MRELMDESKVLFEFTRVKTRINNKEGSKFRDKQLIFQCDDMKTKTSKLEAILVQSTIMMHCRRLQEK